LPNTETDSATLAIDDIRPLLFFHTGAGTCRCVPYGAAPRRTSNTMHTATTPCRAVTVRKGTHRIRCERTLNVIAPINTEITKAMCL